MALGSIWLAYPGNSPTPQNSEQMSQYQPSYSEISVDIAKKTFTGLKWVGDLGVKAVNSLMGSKDNSQGEEEMSDHPYSGTVFIFFLKIQRLLYVMYRQERQLFISEHINNQYHF